MSKTTVLTLSVIVAACLIFLPVPWPRGVFAQSPLQIELACPVGTTVTPGHQTFDSATGKYRQYECVDPFGNLNNQATFFGGLTSAPGFVATATSNIGTDSTSGQVHLFNNSADSLVATAPSSLAANTIPLVIGNARLTNSVLSQSGSQITSSGAVIAATESTGCAGAANQDWICANSTNHQWFVNNNGSGTALAMGVIVGTGTATMTTAAITAGNCGATVTVSTPGVTTADAIYWSFTAAPAGSNAGIVSWVTAGNANFAYCPGVAETPAAATINFHVTR